MAENQQFGFLESGFSNEIKALILEWILLSERNCFKKNVGSICKRAQSGPKWSCAGPKVVASWRLIFKPKILASEKHEQYRPLAGRIDQTHRGPQPLGP
jgi:hypothetical protein